MKLRWACLSFLICACSTNSVIREATGRAPAEAYAQSVFDDIPNKGAFIGWRDEKSYVSSPVAYKDLRKVAFECGRPVLYPTHPQQLLKMYHVFKVGSYDHFKLQGDDEACKLGNKKPNGSGKKLCFRADTIEYAVVSDIYEDECGHLYRAYHESSFLKKDETMGSLFSVGRSSLQNPKSSYENEMIDGPTYPVALREFLFLTDVFPGEEAKVPKLKDAALSSTHVYDSATRTFKLRVR